MIRADPVARSRSTPTEGAAFQVNDATETRRDDAFFASALWYDISINWEARLKRELPLLRNVLGDPVGQRILDAGCGPGHHVAALARLGHGVTGLDASDEMLVLARKRAQEADVEADFIRARFDELPSIGLSFGGIFCLGNALAACGDADLSRMSVLALGKSLAPGGRIVVQTLNFEKLRNEAPAVRGPRVTRIGGTQYISTRVYGFSGDRVSVTNVTLYEAEGGWKKFASSGTLYPVSPEQLADWFAEAGLTIRSQYGGYDRSGFDRGSSNDLITVAANKNE